MRMFFFALVFVPVAAIWYGYALSVLWGWFVVPFGAPHISIAWAYGLMTIVALVTSSLAKDVDETKSETGRMISAAIKCVVWPSLALGIGFIAKGFM